MVICRRAKDLVQTNIGILHRVADVLLEKEQIDGDEFLRIMMEEQASVVSGPSHLTHISACFCCHFCACNVSLAGVLQFPSGRPSAVSSWHMSGASRSDTRVHNLLHSNS